MYFKKDSIQVSSLSRQKKQIYMMFGLYDRSLCHYISKHISIAPYQNIVLQSYRKANIANFTCWSDTYELLQWKKKDEN